ncbi:hypothetical protein KKF34_01320 [Myxococcota bacterium]|nr:hypothetical protein [Myxococcota bacterium]MBU1380042.1 hypothetical protein [Myxococcota bacterium]MBU1495500.1 hypothetical protein [Myxococcota bacterium]
MYKLALVIFIILSTGCASRQNSHQQMNTSEEKMAPGKTEDQTKTTGAATPAIKTPGNKVQPTTSGHRNDMEGTEDIQ